jgi:xanthine dehydrogenase YagR molybdenum-binding subunit
VTAGIPDGGLTASADTTEQIQAQPALARHAFGAQFAEVAVDLDTGEIRVPRLLGVFAVGNVINPVTARSQLIGGITMGLSMALLEESVMDVQFGDYVKSPCRLPHRRERRCPVDRGRLGLRPR